jgi:hypothetical protein
MFFIIPSQVVLVAECLGKPVYFRRQVVGELPFLRRMS